MSYVVRRSKLVIALVASLASLVLCMAGPGTASASWANYCNPVTLGGWQGCNGTVRTLNQTYGWGDQHSVCVGIAGLEFAVKRCSSGPGAGVYSGKTNEAIGATPHIENHAAGTNTVHGVSLAP